MFLRALLLATSLFCCGTALAPPSSSIINNNKSNGRDRLRIIQINDVYQLHYFPHFKTLVDHFQQQSNNDMGGEATPIAKTLVVCSGDFLSPSLLSSLDKGSSMVDTLNAVGVTHVCLGNHEADFGSLNVLGERIQQSQFKWINTNMPQLDQKLDRVMNGDNFDVHNKCPRYDMVQVGTRQVALLGLLTEDSSLYRPGAFEDATIEPVVEATQALLDDLAAQNADLVVPLTHQSMDADRAFCRHFAGKFPVVCGGHDHEIYNETVEGNRIVKTGMDATHAAIIDIEWPTPNCVAPSSSSSPPLINIQMIPTVKFAPNTALQQRIQGHEKVLERLQQARIFRLSDWMNDDDGAYDSHDCFSTRDNRLGPSTGTSAIATLLRMGMRVPCGLINAGSVRGNKIYHDQEYFTWSDLKAEMPFSCAMTVVRLPGHVLESTIASSRSRALQSQEASGAYLHCCSNIKFNDDTMSIESVAGKPFQHDASYPTTLPWLLLTGLDNHAPLLEWVKTTRVIYTGESGIPAKLLIVQVFSMLLWLELGSFEDIDKNKDGVVCRRDVHKRVVEVYGDDAVADLVVNSIFSVADMNNDGTITPLEMMIVQFSATDLIDHVCTVKELTTMKQVASKVLGKDPSHDQVKRMVTKLRDSVDSLDDEIDGLIHREEVMKAVGDFDAEETNLLQ